MKYVLMLLMCVGAVMVTGCNGNQEGKPSALGGSCNRILTPAQVERGESCWK